MKKNQNTYWEPGDKSWELTITKVFGKHPPVSAVWIDPDAIVAILKPFCKPELNHTMLPQTPVMVGGGQDVWGIKRQGEGIRLALDTCQWLDENNDDVLPVSLSFEHFPGCPVHSFFLLDGFVDGGRGKYMMVDKRSRWNERQESYDGGHTFLSSSELRALVQNEINIYGPRIRR